MSTPALRRVIRRETHSPRTVAVFVVVVLVIVALGYLGLELVLHLAAQPALLLDPTTGWGWLLGLPSTAASGLVIGGGVILALVGLVLVWLAVAPGRLPKHVLNGAGRAVVVDNGVIASALAQRLAQETGIARDAVIVGVGHRVVDVTVRPGAGVPLDADEVRTAAEAAVTEYALATPLRIRVRVERPREREDVL